MRIRAMIVGPDGRLSPQWAAVAAHLHRHSPATENPNEMLSALCILAGAQDFVNRARGTSGG